MGKSRRSDKEYTKEQRLSKENRQLKKELAHLRKQIARLDGDRFETLRQMCADSEEKERFNESMGPAKSTVEVLKKDWACRACTEGFLEINLFTKVGETWYYRRCNFCSNRTKSKRYDNQVKGIVKNVE
ncbi:MAG TPA: hypothetical protein VIJ14_04785 [Rhabdochlamydiaceae bacterium]